MEVLYTRTSTLVQNSARQKVNEDKYDLTVEDKCSGAIPFFEREGGKKIQKLISNDKISSLVVHSIDRLGRNLIDILKTINFFNQQKVSIFFKQQGLRTLNENGEENKISKMIISLLGTVAEMERIQIKERQKEGIAIAKAKGVYKGRKKGAKEDVLRFLSKEKNKKAIELLKKNYKQSEVAKIVGLHPNTVSKINKILKNEIID